MKKKIKPEKAKTRLFTLDESKRSRTAANGASEFARTWSITPRCIIRDENGYPTVLAHSLSQKSINVDDWPIGLDETRSPILTHPLFENGALVCTPNKALTAEYLWNHIACGNGPNADPNNVQFNEILSEDKAEYNRITRKNKSKAEGLIFEMNDDELINLCTIYKLPVRDIDGDILVLDNLQDMLMDKLDDTDGHEDFLIDISDDSMDVKSNIAAGLNSNVLVYDAGLRALGFDSSSMVFSTTSNGDIFEDSYRWIIGTKEGANFYSILITKLNLGKDFEVVETKDSNANKVSEKFNKVKNDNAYSDMTPQDLFEIAKKIKVITWNKESRAFQLEGSDIKFLDGRVASTKNSAIEAISTTQSVREEVESAMSLNESSK